MIRGHDTSLVTHRWNKGIFKREGGGQDSCLKNWFYGCGHWLFFFLRETSSQQRAKSWGHFPLLSELYRSPPSQIISSVSPLLCGNYKREKDDCKTIKAAIIFIKTFPTVLFPFHFLPSVLFPSLQSYVCFSPYLISSSLCWHFPLFPSLSSPLPPNMLLCLLGRISQMCVICSGKNVGFSSFFHEKIEKRHTHWRTGSSHATAHSEEGDG